MATAQAPARQQKQAPAPIAPDSEIALKIDEIAKKYAISNPSEIASNFGLALRRAEGIKALKEALTEEVMASVMPLQGTSLGFKTDRDNATEGPREYAVPAVRECIIEGMLRGAMITGNEMNIIASRCYLTKEFYQRACLELEGLQNLVMTPGVPIYQPEQKRAFVPFKAHWRYRGKAMAVNFGTVKAEDGKTLIEDTRICVRVNAKSGDDAVLGKAERKVRKRIYEMCTGTVHSEEDDKDIIVVEPEDVSQVEDPKAGEQSQDENPKSGEESQATEKSAGEEPQQEMWEYRLREALGECSTSDDVLLLKQWQLGEWPGELRQILDRECQARINELKAARK